MNVFPSLRVAICHSESSARSTVTHHSINNISLHENDIHFLQASVISHGKVL